MFDLLFRLEQKYPQSLHYFWVIFVLCLNLLISDLVRKSGSFYIPNEQPIGYTFGYMWSVVLISVISWLAFELELIYKSPVSLIFIIGGVYSNFVERLMWGNVADYMHIRVGYINLADIQIFLGLFILNLHVWFFYDKNKSFIKKHVQT